MSNIKKIAWDLSKIYKNTSDPKLKAKFVDLDKKADEIEKKYKNHINSDNFTAEKLLELFKITENFSEELGELGNFSQLLFAANMTLPENEALYSKFQDFNTKMNKKFAFFDLEIGNLLEKNPDIIKNPSLKNYKHHLEKLKRIFSHKLSEIEEILIFEKDQYGVNSWSELQSKWLNTRKFEVKVEGVNKMLTYGEANGLLSHSDRKTRSSANKAIYGLLGKENEIYTTSLRNICSDWVRNSKRRNYQSPMHKSLISNDITQKTIDNLMSSIENNVQIYRKYLNLKAKLMNLPKLGCQDIVAPLTDYPKIKYNWENSKKIILEAYGKFDGEFKNIVEDIYNRNHIDASPRFGKRNGAFCSDWYKGKSAFILQTFSGNLNDVSTLIHELGHGIHAYLFSKNQTILNTEIAAVIAEIASIFGELLLADLILEEKAKTPKEKIVILTNILDQAGMAIFQVSSRVWFEKNLYKSIENGKFLDGDTISKLWTDARDKIYGESVEWFDEMNWEWAMKIHYFIPNFRFYNYPYVFAQLFVFALYRIYQQEGKKFIPKFKKILKSGSSISPKQIGEIVGFDITDAKFWEIGIKQYEIFVNQIEKLID